MSSDNPDRKKREGAELLVSSVLFLVSAFFLYYSLIMERPGDTWQTAPGLLPLILSASLCVMAGVVVVSSIRDGGLSALAGLRKNAAADAIRDSWRLLVAILAVAVFYFGLLRFLPFEVAAILFFAFMTRIFWAEAGWPKRIAVSIAIPIVIAAIFQAGFGIPLPGEDNLVERLVFAIGR